MEIMGFKFFVFIDIIIVKIYIFPVNVRKKLAFKNYLLENTLIKIFLNTMYGIE